MPRFKFVLIVCAESVSEREEQLPNVSAAEIFGRGLLANVEQAGLGERGCICIQDEKNEFVMFLKRSNEGLSWRPTLW